MKVFFGIVLSVLAFNAFSIDINTVIFSGVVLQDSYFSEDDPLIHDSIDIIIRKLSALFEKNGHSFVQKDSDEFREFSDPEVEGDTEKKILGRSITAHFISLDDGMPALLFTMHAADGALLVETVGVFVTLEEIEFIIEDFYYEIENILETEY